MLILLETSAGFGLFKVLKQKKLKNVDDIYSQFETPEKASEVVQLEAFTKFKNTQQAIKATSKLIKGKIPKKLKTFLKNNIISKEIQDNLAISNKKLAKTIKDELGITCQSDNLTLEIFRGIKSQLTNLVQGLTQEELKNMTLGLAHGLSRYKLKFSVEKIDTMVIQAISLLDDLDKEINNYMMRLREWYGSHFPELSKIITDNLIYAKTTNAVGIRYNAKNIDLSEILQEDIEKEVKEAAEISMGADISAIDEKYIVNLSQQVIDLHEYRRSLNEYLKNRMNAIAPNITIMLGELISARLISNAGSLLNLAKYPASTLQLLGAEKALFKAMRTKHNTPKYGVIYQANLVSSAPQKIKAKVSRALAAKCSLCARVDALEIQQDGDSTLGMDSREYIERRIAFLDTGVKQKPVKKTLEKVMNKTTLNEYNQQNDIVKSEVADKKKKKKKSLVEEPEEVVADKKQKKVKKQ